MESSSYGTHVPGWDEEHIGIQIKWTNGENNEDTKTNYKEHITVFKLIELKNAV